MKHNDNRTLTPKLRFPEFRDKPGWEQWPLGALTEPITERVGDSDCVPYTVTSGEGLISQKVKYGRTIAGKSLKNYYRLRNNDFAFNKSATKRFPQGYIARYQGDERAAVPNSIFTCFRISDENVDPTFLDYLFQGNLHGRWLKDYITVGARAHGALNINDNDLYSLPIPLPAGDETIAEQQKIADCLSSLDALITAEGRKLTALRDHKRGLMQQLFPQPGETQPLLRFPEFRDKGEWEVLPLHKLAKRVTKRNVNFSQSRVLTNSAEIGVVDQGSYFDRKIVTKSNLDGYYIVKKGDFVYNPRISNLAPVGPISRNDLGTGVMSPLYTVFRFVTPSTDYFAQLFKTSVWHPYLKESSNSGARHDRMNITTADFFNIPLPVPAADEQNRIADCLTILDDQIGAQSKKIEALKQHKRGLIQQLFPAPEEP